MMQLTLSRVAELSGGRLIGGDGAADTMTDGMTQDSRSVSPNQLFVALPGEQADGHDYAAAAARAGAGAALVSRKLDLEIPQVVVEDVVRAMGLIASGWRDELDVEVIGITGSNGKTTVKEMVAAILSEDGPTLATRGNYNNELGVPLTLARLDRSHRYAVVEMGCGQPGDIRYLAELAHPRIGVVTNAGPAHLERLGSIEGVANTKGELFAALPSDGVAIINADDAFADQWRQTASHCRRLTFGLKAGADVHPEHSNGDVLDMITPAGRIVTRLAVPGQHNRINALAATAVAIALEIEPEKIARALAGIRSLPGRLELHRSAAGWSLIDDTYNANPASLYAGLRVISEMDGEPWLVLGDMAELGTWSDKLHGEMGQAAADLGVRRLFTVGTQSRASQITFGAGGAHYDDHEALASALAEALHPGVICLVKGSRSMGMERIVQALIGQDSNGEKS